MVYHAIFTRLFLRNNPQRGHFQVIEWRLNKRAPNAPLTNFFIQLTVNSLGFAMLIAGSMKSGHEVSLENVNKNHEQSLLKVPE